MAKGHENLIPLNKRSKEVQREIQEKGRQANKTKWEKKKDLRERAIAFMEAAADPRVAAALAKTGVEVADNTDVVMAGIYKGVIKGDTKALAMWLDLTGQNPRANSKVKQAEERKAEAEATRAEMETELFKMRLDAIKGIGQEEMPDDGFLNALKATAAEDWSNDIL